MPNSPVPKMKRINMERKSTQSVVLKRFISPGTRTDDDAGGGGQDRKERISKQRRKARKSLKSEQRRL